jgi:tyrosine-protein kinase Etk/Wzc
MRIPDLQAQIRAKEIQLGVTRKFATDDNMSVRQIMAELDVLRQQLAEAEAVSPKVEESVGRVVKESTKAQDLLRELMIARTLFDSYVRFLEGTSVEDLTSTGNLRELEPPFVDSHWQIKTIPAGLFLILLLAGLAIEFYGVRPPVGAMRDGE